jgi:hypothetical protein
VCCTLPRTCNGPDGIRSPAAGGMVQGKP